MATLVAGFAPLNYHKKIVSLIASRHGQLFRVAERQGWWENKAQNVLMIPRKRFEIKRKTFYDSRFKVLYFLYIYKLQSNVQ